MTLGTLPQRFHDRHLRPRHSCDAALIEVRASPQMGALCRAQCVLCRERLPPVCARRRAADGVCALAVLGRGGAGAPEAAERRLRRPLTPFTRAGHAGGTE